MKNFFLTVTLFALTFTPVFAQKNLPPSLEAYTAHFSWNLKKMLNAAGFELPNAQVDAHVQRGLSGRSEELQLDSILTFYNYDPTAMLDSLPLSRTVHTYPAANEQLQLTSIFENGGWSPFSRTALTYDDLDRVLAAFSENYDAASMTWTPDSKMQVFPHGDSELLLDSFFVQAWSVDLDEWIEIMAVRNTYDSLGRLATSTTLFDFFGQPLYFKDVHFYNLAGDDYLVEAYVIDGGLELLAGKRDRIFEQHHLVKEFAFVHDGNGGFEPQYEHVFIHTGFWALDSQVLYNWDADNGTWWVAEAVFYGYDDQQRLNSMETTHGSPDGDTESQLVTYEYLQDEYVSLETNFTYDPALENFVLSDRIYYYYNGEITALPQEPAAVQPLLIYPNPTPGVAQLKTEAPMSVQVYDLSGRLVQGFSVMPGNATLDLSLFPDGIYQVRAQAGREIFAGKIVKQ